MKYYKGRIIRMGNLDCDTQLIQVITPSGSVMTMPTAPINIPCLFMRLYGPFEINLGYMTEEMFNDDEGVARFCEEQIKEMKKCLSDME